MSWTTPATVTVGQMLTASFLNAQFRDNAQYLYDTKRTSSVIDVPGPGAGWGQSLAAAGAWDILGTNGISTTFVKRQADTGLLVYGTLGHYLTVNSQYQLGFMVNGVDYIQYRTGLQETNVHVTKAFFSWLPPGTLGAGSFLIKMRVAVGAGQGGQIILDGNDSAHFAVFETAP